jgi:hypothetical protein
MQEINIDFQVAALDADDVSELDVTYHYDGVYVAQTYWQPSEEPEIQLDEVMCGGVDVSESLTDKEWDKLATAIDEERSC